MRLCNICKTEIHGKNNNINYCSIPCYNEIKWKQILIKHPKVDRATLCKCKECGFEAMSLQAHFRQSHNMTLTVYHKKYNTTTNDTLHPLLSSVFSNNWKDTKNPGYGHGGTKSPFSELNMYYAHLPKDEFDKKINDNKAKANNTRDINNSYTNRIEYYTNKGMTLEEAHTALSMRQATFTKQKCIEKYGVDIGLATFIDRQKRWQKSLYNRSPAEIEVMVRKRLSGAGYSSMAVGMFKLVCEASVRYRYQNNDLNITEEFVIGPYRKMLLDFCDKDTKKVIEFNGDLWHANPTKFKADDIPLSRFGSTRTAKEIWERDELRQIELESMRYEVMVIWESDYKANKIGTVNKCRIFLGLEEIV